MLASRTAIVHDWFQGFHGAERVVDRMLDLFDETPDIFTFHAARNLLPERVVDAIAGESRLASLPGLRQRGHDPGRWRWLLPYMPRYFDGLDLRDYEVVISSTHACAAGVRTNPDALHLAYCYTPMRYVWLDGTDGERVTGLKRAGLQAFRGHLRRHDLRASRRPDRYISISTAVRDRVREIYGRDSDVVHPPVEVANLRPEPKDEGLFLWVHRLVSYKRPLEVAEAFAELPDLRLVMVGVGPLEEELRASLPPNVTLQGWTSREDLRSLYARASGFVHVGEEDFGITMVEALASGTPVLALDRGGSRDIVRPGVDGLFVSEPSVEQIRAGVDALARADWDPQQLRAGAERFSESAFADRLAAVLRDAGAR